MNTHMNTWNLTVLSNGQISLHQTFEDDYLFYRDKPVKYVSEDIFMFKISRFPADKDFEGSPKKAKE